MNAGRRATLNRRRPVFTWEGRVKTNVQATSIEAYARIKTINRREREVLGVIIEHGPISNQQIADILASPVNRITGRTFDLRGKGLVEEAHRAEYNGRNVIHWRVVPLQQSLGLSEL